MMKKLWLDDIRPEPEGWDRAKTASHAIMLLATGEYDEISLDHDLGLEDGAGDGYQVACWLEETVHTDSNFFVPRVSIHTDNASVRNKMLQTAQNIERIRQQRIGGF
jgi:hypothetical protein